MSKNSEVHELVPYTDHIDGFKYWPTTQEFSQGTYMLKPVSDLPGVVVEIYFSEHRMGSDYCAGRHHIIIKRELLFSTLACLYEGNLGLKYVEGHPEKSTLVPLNKSKSGIKQKKSKSVSSTVRKGKNA